MGIQPCSNLREVIEQQMSTNPGYWAERYTGSAQKVREMRTYSYSDRIRHYWSDPVVASALTVLESSLAGKTLPETIVSQAVMELEFGEIPTGHDALTERHIQRCVKRYFHAAGHLS